MGKKEHIIRRSSGIGFLSGYRRGKPSWASDYQEAIKVDHQKAILILTELEELGYKVNICRLQGRKV